MKFITDIINEGKQDEITLTYADLKQYSDKLSKQLSQDVQIIIQYCLKYNILSNTDLIYCYTANKSGLKVFAKNHQMPEVEAQDLQKLLKKVFENGEYRAIPLCQLEDDMAALMKGDKMMDDILLDLETEQGKQEVAKKYMYLVTAIAHKYINKSALNKNELISAGQLGLVNAINNYRKPDTYVDADDKIIDKSEAKKQKRLSFKTYASYMIRNSILYDINHLSRVVKTGQYGYEQAKKQGLSSFEISIDRDLNGDDMQLDRLTNISTNPDYMTPDAKTQWGQLFKLLEKKFNTRSMTIFYKYFGLNGYEKMKGHEIAKEFGVSNPRISGIIKNMMSYLKDDPKSKSILADLMDIYTESLLVDCIGQSKEGIMESMLQDDIYILLEELTRWSNKEYFKQILTNSIAGFDNKSAEFLLECLNGGFDYIDNHFKKNKRLIIAFLEKMYPTENFYRKSDVYIIEKFIDIVDSYNEYKIQL